MVTKLPFVREFFKVPPYHSVGASPDLASVKGPKRFITITITCQSPGTITVTHHCHRCQAPQVQASLAQALVKQRLRHMSET